MCDHPKLMKQQILFSAESDAPNPWKEWGLGAFTGNCRFIVDKRFEKVELPSYLASIWNPSKTLFLEGGEGTKSIETCHEIWGWLDASGTNRGTWTCVVGGGTITDVAGFALSTYKRGVPFILVPTTLVGMIDASIGGKNGVNYHGFKNQIGTFQLPKATIIDGSWMDTLDSLQLISGWMELCKHGLIHDALFWDSLQDCNPLNTKQIAPFIERAANIKQEIVELDLLDHGARKALNLGHTVAHAIEWLAHKETMSISHGIAVGWGMIWSLEWSGNYATDETTQASLNQAQISLRKWLDLIPEENQSAWLSQIAPNSLWAAIEKDKKNEANRVYDVYLTSIGEAKWHTEISLESFTSVWKQVFK